MPAPTACMHAVSGSISLPSQGFFSPFPHDNARHSAAEGAATAVWLATRVLTAGVTQTGLLWEDNEVVPW